MFHAHTSNGSCSFFRFQSDIKTRRHWILYVNVTTILVLVMYVAWFHTKLNGTMTNLQLTVNFLTSKSSFKLTNIICVFHSTIQTGSKHFLSLAIDQHTYQQKIPWGTPQGEGLWISIESTILTYRYFPNDFFAKISQYTQPICLTHVCLVYTHIHTY